MPRVDILKGVRMIDLTQALAGASGSQLLADLGVEVIKIEQPGTGDITRASAPKLEGEGYFYLAVNRNKKGITLDLSTASGQEALRDLAGASDIVFDNFRPGTLNRLGADFETLRKVNPRVISCSISGYGSSGPYAEYPAFEDIAEGIGGAHSLCGEPDRRPLRAAVDAADQGAGLYAVTGIISALFERERTGEGCRIEVNMLDSIVHLIAVPFQCYFVGGQVPQPPGWTHPVAPMVGIFRTRDGFLTLGPSWPRIARVVGKEWMIEDPRFNTVEGRWENKRELEDLIEEGLSQADTADWLELMHVEDIAAGPVHTLDKTVSDPQIVHNRTIVNMHHPLCGNVKGIDCPIKFIHKTEHPHAPPPTLGQHTDEVLSDILGYSEAKIQRLKQEEETAGQSKPRVRRRL